jgi:beta-lactam-binding protein with PASTA domain/serine/threonine protein kinase
MTQACPTPGQPTTRGLGDLRTYTCGVGTAVEDSLVGRLVDGRYRVRSRIARGGMATVYEASDERLNRDVALKVMHPDLAEDDAFVQRFIAEARSAAKLSRDRTIVTVFDQGESDGIVWLALELVRGRTLRQLILDRGRLDARTALAVMEPVLTALAAAHDAGIVHRDVKPENVLIGDDGHIQVADFGLAYAVSNAPRSAATRGLLLGTVAYLSPEQALGKTATQASDVYAAGIMLYELLTGHPPYDGATDYLVVRRHVDEDVPAPSDEVPDVPREVDTLVAVATARDTSDRFADAGAFLGAVRRTRKLIERDRQTGPIEPVDVRTDAASDAAGVAGAFVAGAAAASGAARPDSDTAAEADADAATTDQQLAARSDTNPIHHSTTSLDPVGAEPPTQTTLPPSEARPKEPDDPFQTPPKQPRAKRRLRRLALILLVAAVVGGAGWWWLEGRLVDTPTLVGMTVEQAEQVADDEGLGVEVVGEEYSETIPVDAVVATDPGQGSRIAPGETVGLVLSLGPERYDVPSIVGLTRDEAEAQLDELTLVPGEVTRRYNEEIEQGRVVSQDPAAGTEVRRAAEVSFVLSRGRRPIEVPDVVGRQRARAVTQIEEAGLVAQVGEEYSTEVDRGTVISQDPDDGTLFRGDEVSIVVSLGPETIEVPDVEGDDADAAKATLEDAGLTVRTVVLLPAGPNNVLRQAPAEGSTVRVGTEVTIYIF